VDYRACSEWVVLGDWSTPPRDRTPDKCAVHSSGRIERRGRTGCLAVPYSHGGSEAVPIPSPRLWRGRLRSLDRGERVPPQHERLQPQRAILL